MRQHSFTCAVLVYKTSMTDHFEHASMQEILKFSHRSVTTVTLRYFVFVYAHLHVHDVTGCNFSHCNISLRNNFISN